MIALLAALNIRGLRESASLNIFLAIADLVTQVAAGHAGRRARLRPLAAGRPDPPGRGAHAGREVIFALSISMVAYTGIETVSNMAEEARDPGRGRAAHRQLVLLAVLGIFAGISIISLIGPAGDPGRARATTRPRSGTTYKDDPVLGIVSALAASARRSRPRFRYYVGVLAATILVIATNAGLIGISRLSWSLAEHRQLPRALRPRPPQVPHALVHDRLLLGPRRRCC